jgi:hypothetical protein
VTGNPARPKGIRQRPAALRKRCVPLWGQAGRGAMGTFPDSFPIQCRFIAAGGRSPERLAPAVR